ncbi:lipopolysaccharide biosynthesis protein [Thomasclavelia sp.]
MENNLKKNVIWNTLGITLNSFNSLFFLIIINRINGINDGGIFSFAFSLACLLFVIGIYAGRTYQISDVNNELNDSEYLVHKILTCILMVVICLGYMLIKGYSLEKNIIIITLTLYKGLEAFSDTLYGYMQKKSHLYLCGISQTIKSIISIIAFLFIDLVTKNLIYSCISLVVINFLVIIFFDRPISKKMMKNEEINMCSVFNLFKSGFTIFAFSFLAIYIVNVPKYTIDGLMDNSFQTIFNIIVMPATVISLCGQYIMGPILTELVEVYNKKEYLKFKCLIYKIIKLIVLFGIVVEVGAYLFGIPILSLVYAIDLSAYKYDLMIIILGAIFYALANVFSTGLITMRKNNMQLAIYVSSAIIGWILSNLLIKQIGIDGAMYAYFGTMLWHGLLYTFYFRYEYKKMCQT